jgi:hypothetical protein
MAALVRPHPIENKFLSAEPAAGTDKNFQGTLDGVKQWEHFFVNIPEQYVSKDIGTKLGEHRATFDVMKRGLTELTSESVAAVMELIDQNSLYRGAEHMPALREFMRLKAEYDGTDTFIWKNLDVKHRFRNTVIGTLVTDLSNGVDLEDAVKMFETKVAPTNYKRPTALVTKAMIEKAKQTIDAAGLASALERRYATINDITINNVLFADRSTPLVKDVFASLIATAPLKTFGKVEEMSIDKFITDVLPSAKTIEVMMENSHQPNLVSLIAPTDATANPLFKWGNAFSWDYNGGVADSIKERVKAAGGNTRGDLCCRLAWYNTDDLDLKMYETNNAKADYNIYYGNRNVMSPNGGRLDVDANGGSGMMEHPVENIFYTYLPTKGSFELKVNQFSRRSTTNGGFEVEIELQGQTYNYVHAEHLRSGDTITVAKFEASLEGFKLTTDLKQNRASKLVWGLNTNMFTKVNALMMSPNYWDGEQTGNKHYFFMLDGCANEGQARGFFNEFLREDLTQHRKTLEMVGSKLQTAPATQQLSGLGFSSTQRNSVLAKVSGAFTRVIKIVF